FLVTYELLKSPPVSNTLVNNPIVSIPGGVVSKFKFVLIPASPLLFKTPSKTVNSCIGKLLDGSVKVYFGKDLNSVSDEKIVASTLAFKFCAVAPLSQLD